MRYQYSEAVNNDQYEDDGLANGIQLRMHKDSHKEIASTLRLQRDWNQLVSPVREYHGGLGDRFSFISVTVPECLPERLEIVSYANEFAFLYDGMSPPILFPAAATCMTDGSETKWNS
jgi:hypothetical protein